MTMRLNIWSSDTLVPPIHCLAVTEAPLITVFMNACAVIPSVLPIMHLIVFPAHRTVSDLGLSSLFMNGHTQYIIPKDCDDADDVLTKKISFIGEANKVLYNFRKVDCVTKTKLVNAYCTSFYSAEIWDLSHRVIVISNQSVPPGSRDLGGYGKFLAQLAWFYYRA
jgi:hypothetical protein